MTELITFTVVGLAIGSIYSIASVGLVVTYTTSGIFNFAHGAIGIVTAIKYGSRCACMYDLRTVGVGAVELYSSSSGTRTATLR